MVRIYDSIVKDAADSPIDFGKMDFRKLQTPLKSSKSNRELSGGQNTTATGQQQNKIKNKNNIFDL